MIKTYAYGFPRLGPNREFKKLIESFWQGQLSDEQLTEGLSDIQNKTTLRYREKVDMAPDGEITYYDFMLDTAILCGIYDP
ncbi:MAG: hypothetical protein PVI90_17370, partial [Desulfobacteraceae bacterium]